MITNNLTNQIFEVSQRKVSITAGIGLLMSFFGAMFAFGFVFDTLIVQGDPTTTAKNIMDSEMLFRIGIVSWIIVFLGDTIRAWAFYVLLKQVNKSIAILSAWFMLFHVTIMGITLATLFVALYFLSGADFLTVFNPDQLQAFSLIALNIFDYGFLLGLLFFSFHLGIVGFLVYKSGYIPKILGILLIVAFGGYLIDSLSQILFPEYAGIINKIFMMPNLIGEVAVCMWLLFKGGKENESQS